MKKQPTPRFGPTVQAKSDSSSIEFRRTEDPRLADVSYEKWGNVTSGPIRVTKAK